MAEHTWAEMTLVTASLWDPPLLTLPHIPCIEEQAGKHSQGAPLPSENLIFLKDEPRRRQRLKGNKE